MKPAVGTAGSEATPPPLSLAAARQLFEYRPLIGWLVARRRHVYGHPRGGGSGRAIDPGRAGLGSPGATARPRASVPGPRRSPAWASLGLPSVAPAAVTSVPSSKKKSSFIQKSK